MPDDTIMQRILNDLEHLDKQNVLAVLESMRMIQEETGWGETLIIQKAGNVDEIKTVISKRGENLKG
jgi:hypothetical protein